jgi:hypothetical protein
MPRCCPDSEWTWTAAADEPFGRDWIQRRRFLPYPPGHDPVVSLFSGLPDTLHVLELEAEDASALSLRELRVYHPGGPDIGADPAGFTFLAAADRTAVVSAPGRDVQVEVATDISGGWQALSLKRSGETNHQGRRGQRVAPEPGQFFRSRGAAEIGRHPLG